MQTEVGECVDMHADALREPTQKFLLECDGCLRTCACGGLGVACVRLATEGRADALMSMHALA